MGRSRATDRGHGASVADPAPTMPDAADPESFALEGERAFPATASKLRWFDIGMLAVLGIVAVVLRFWTRSPMWLDEALTVNIARQPLGDIAGALRNDGHPPLYYYLLHGWMSVFGESDRMIRVLPGIFGVAAVPVTWLLGRRIGGRSVAWSAAVIVAVLPYAIRYSTENRMYSLIMLLVPLAWLCADSALRRTRPAPLIGLAVCTAALLWSQYWSLWAGTAAALIVLVKMVRDARARRSDATRRSAWVLGALGIGAVSFIPWLPTMLYQQAHTATPWATRSMPPTLIVTSVQALGGPMNATNEIAGWIFSVFVVIGLFGLGVASGRIELDLRTRPWARSLALPAALTLAIGSAVMLVTNSAFQPRYNAVWLPLVIVVGGIGLAVIRGPVLQRCAIVLVVLAAAPGNFQNVTKARTQAVEAATVIQRYGEPGDVVAVCPDQLGPSLDRALGPGFDVGTFPTFGDPAIVDWSDYVARSRSVTPAAFAEDLLARAGDDKRIFVVWSPSYITHRTLCTDLVTALTAHRPDNRQVLDADRGFYESENVTGFWSGPIP